MIRKVKTVEVPNERKGTHTERTSRVTLSSKQSKGSYYDKDHRRAPKPVIAKDRSFNTYRVGSSLMSFTGFLSGGLSIFFAIFLIVLLTRAYSGYGYISLKTVLDVFSNTASSGNNTWSSWMSVASDWINFASTTVSLSSYVKPANDFLSALIGIFDVVVNIPNTLLLITQGLITVFNFFGQAVYMISSFLLGISKLTSAGTMLEDSLSDAREAVWNSWIA